MNKDRIIQKWSPVFKSHGLKSKKVIELFCLFSEDYQIRASKGLVDGNKLPQVIRDLIKKLEESERKEVIRTLYNPINGKIEYELEGGIIIDEDNKLKHEPSIKQLVELFGVDFIREVDKSGFREERINSLL